VPLADISIRFVPMENSGEDGDGRTVLAPYVHPKANCATMSRAGPVQRKNMMRNALLTISALAVSGALLCSPEQSAQAQMLGGLKASAANDSNLVTLVRRGGGGRGHVAHRGGGRAMHAYLGGGKFYGHGGARRYAYNRGHYDNVRRYADHGAYRRYGYYGGYRRYG